MKIQGKNEIDTSSLPAIHCDSFFENSLTGIYCILDRKFIYVNKRYAEIVGYTIEELLEKVDPEDLIAESHKPIFHQKLQERLSGKVKYVDYVVEAVRKDGRHIYCQVLSWIIERNHQKIIQGMISDITRQREIEKQLKTSEEKYRSFFENAFYGIFQARPDWHFITVNDALAQILGYASKDELKTLQDPLQIFYNDAEFEQMQSRLYQEKRLQEFVITLKKSNGSPVIVKLNIRLVLNEANRISYIEGMLQDITEQMKAEAEINRLANFPQRNPNPVLELNADGEILYYNPAMVDLLKKFDIAQDDILRMLPPKLKETCRKIVKKRIATKTVEVKFEDHIFLWSFHFIPNENVIHLYGYDITQQKSLEQQLIHSQKMESIGTLAGGIAHDFNNLLMGILGYTSIILSDLPDDHELYEDIRNIDKAAQKAADLTRQLLSFSRKSVGEPQIVSINDLVEETVNLFSRAMKNGARVELHLAHNLSGVMIDPAQFQQILMNLLVNARDAMPNGGKITLITEEKEATTKELLQDPEISPGKYIFITVKDEGVGISSEHLQRIFEPFYTTKEVGQGTGLGLSLVYNYVRNAGGHILVKSQIGEGTEFKILLPGCEMESREELQDESNYPPGNENILVVDDEESIVQIATRMLTMFGYQVFSATDARKALEVFKARQGIFDLVLLDLTMPEVDGLQLLEQFKSIKPELKAIIASGYHSLEDPGKIFAAGANKFLQKPFQLSELLQAVRSTLDGN